MKVLGIVFSPRKKGNTEILVNEALTGAKECGAETELVAVRDYEINPCEGCMSCEKTGKCKINDDMQIMYNKLLEADGVIFGAPVYFWNICGQAKIFIDRTVALSSPTLRLANKVGAIITVAMRTGASEAGSFFIKYCVHNHMTVTEAVDGLAIEKGSIVDDERAMKASKELGKTVALTIKLKNRFPESYNIPLYRLAQKHGAPTYPRNP